MPSGRPHRKGHYARLVLVAGSWIAIALLVFAFAVASPRSLSGQSSDSVNLMAQFVEIKLKPGDESVYSADCNNMTAPNGAELDDKQFVFSIFLNGSSTQSFGGKAVSNVSWTDSTNRSEKGRSASNTSIQGADPVLRHDGLYCSDSFPVLIEFQARLNYGDGSTEIVKAAVKIEKS